MRSSPAGPASTPPGRPPAARQVADVAERVSSSIRRWAAELDSDGLLVVASHGAAIRLGIARLMNLPQELWPALGGLGNCSLVGAGGGAQGLAPA